MAIYFFCTDNSRFDEGETLLQKKYGFVKDPVIGQLWGPEKGEYAVFERKTNSVQVNIPPIDTNKLTPRDKVPPAFTDLVELLKPYKILSEDRTPLSLAGLISQ